MKGYTSLEQSKKLAEILPLESADMGYIPSAEDDDGNTLYTADFKSEFIFDEDCIPCWSLAALLDVIPKHIKDYNVLRIDIGEKDFSIWYDEIGFGVNSDLPDITMEEPIDACVDMIEKLHEQKLL